MSHRRNVRNAGSATAIAILLISVAFAAGWLAFSPALLGQSGGPTAWDGNMAQVEIGTPQAAPLLEGIRLNGDLQFSQPRDPFRPLITDQGVSDGPGASGTPSPGTGEPGGGGTIFRLVDINETGGVFTATVDVNGVSYDVGVGDTFAGSFKVVSIDSNGAVFLYGDNAFELTVGQEIIK